MDFLQYLDARARATLLALLMATVAGCGEDAAEPKERPTALLAELTSDNQHFRVQLALEQGDSVPIGRYHSWLLTLSDAQRAQVYPATIAITGGMPSHGHGLPTEPRVTEHLGQGVYRIEGLKFHMAGKWILRFHIATEHMQDHIETTLNIAP